MIELYVGFALVIVGGWILTWSSIKATSIGWGHIIGGLLMLASVFVVSLPLMRYAVGGGGYTREVVSLLLAAAAFILVIVGFPMATNPQYFFTKRERSTVKKTGQICFVLGIATMIVGVVIGLWR